MKILVACEESQVVCKAFRSRGHVAYSCDIKECSGGYPEWHILGDVLNILEPMEFMPPDELYYTYGIPFETQDGKYHEIRGGWDMMIGHPPCTYLTRAGACNFYINGRRVEERFKEQEKARDFFMTLYEANIPRICLENPVPMRAAGLPPWTQVIYPELFGAKQTKQTCLWLKGLPPLLPYFSASELNLKSLCAITSSAVKRSKTFPEVAEAMAQQWNF